MDFKTQENNLRLIIKFFYKQLQEFRVKKLGDGSEVIERNPDFVPVDEWELKPHVEELKLHLALIWKEQAAKL